MDAQAARFAIFGDVHGHLRLVLALCQQWQLAHGVHLDGVLLCGDLGFFPDLSRADKATRRYIERDPEEAGFALYFAMPQPLSLDPLVQRTLLGNPADLGTIRCPIVFCHGNHEDFAMLEQATRGSALAPVDAFGRILYLRSGNVLELGPVRIGALGGGPELSDQDNEVVGRWVSSLAAACLVEKHFDVLLSHAAPRGIGGESDLLGSSLLRQVVELCQPVYHVFGHHRERIAPARVGRTQCVWFNRVQFQRDQHRQHTGPPEPGCMGLLSWVGPDCHELVVLDEPWFRRMTGTHWRYYTVV